MSNELVGIIAAAGPGNRLRPKSEKMSKVLMTVDGRSLILRNIMIMKEALGISRIYVITGDNRRAVENELGDGSDFGGSIHYLSNPTPETGLAEGLLTAEFHVQSDFCLMLSDELYCDSGHESLKTMIPGDWFAVCGVKKGANPHEIRKNYSVEISDGAVRTLCEKPSVITNDYLGCGTFLFKPEIFRFIRMTVPSSVTGNRELADSIDLAIRSGRSVRPFFIGGHYVNINTIDDLNYANYCVRRKRFEKKRISLVIPAWNESDSIGYVIDDFRNQVDEIIVADNRSVDGTAGIAEAGGATVFSRHFKGYGDAIRYGVNKATGEVVVITEADGSFKSRDLGKLLEYLKDADMVIGTRTTKQLIEQGANMSLPVRIGNVCVAKLIEILWWRYHEPRLTDVGCTYRAIWKDAWDRITPHMKEDGPSFSPEMIIEPIRHYMRIIEIPVSYHGRIGGDSKHSGTLLMTIRTGMGMVLLIMKKKIVTIWADRVLPRLQKRTK